MTIVKDHIIICGLGEIGFQVFTLLQRAGIKVAVIANKTHAEWIWQIKRSGNLFFSGDARDDNVLIESGIQNAKAILTLTNDDHVNLSIAVDAKKLNPAIKIISRIYDTELGNLVSRAFDIDQVFSTSELAAPIFSENISHQKILGKFKLGEKSYVVTETSNKPKKQMMTLYETHDINLVAKPVKTRKSKSSLFKFNRYIFRNPVYGFFSRFLVILFFIILFSTLLLSYAMPLSLTNAVYFVIATITSVGYGDINFLHTTDALKYFGCLLMLTGTTILAVLFSTITEMIILKRLPNIAGGFPVPKKDHVIVIGANRVGTRIMNHLIADSIPTVVIEDVVRFPVDISRQTSVVNGNPSSINTLSSANIKNAKAVVAVTEDDIKNLSIGLAAKKLNSSIIELMQINNIQIRGNLKQELAATNIFSVPFIASPYFVAAIMQTQIIFAIEWRNILLYISNDNGSIQINSIFLHDTLE
jgi:Trk K+ transport system NAD-binding subunit